MALGEQARWTHEMSHLSRFETWHTGHFMRPSGFFDLLKPPFNTVNSKKQNKTKNLGY
jgi:hypothetical protein